MEISEIIAKGSNYTQDEVEELQGEIRFFLSKIEASRDEIMAERTKMVFSPVILDIFFRQEERNEKINQILQYLLTFLDNIPGIAESDNIPLNPIEQFRELISYEVGLLLEKDVKKAIFNEINQVGSLNGENVWDYLGRISEKNRELNELIVTGASDVSSMFFTLCLVLEQLCLFWFDVKQENMHRIRRSDIYIFRLACILQGRYRRSRE